jgi:galactonate dehydratase
VARRFEPLNLSTYEEPVSPANLSETEAIHDAIRQTMSGGENLFGVEGFSPVCRNRALDIIMPDVKWCGGVKEAGKIAQLAKANDVLVSPHNPSGPVGTAVNAALCARMSNFVNLEYAWVRFHGATSSLRRRNGSSTENYPLATAQDSA